MPLASKALRTTSITVSVFGNSPEASADDAGSSMPFLTPTYYRALWSYAFYSCPRFLTTAWAYPPAFSTGAPPNIDIIPTSSGAPPNTTSTTADVIQSTPSSVGTLWPPGDQLVDYSDCNFDCCTNEDCTVEDSNKCCTDGMCQVKASWMDPTPGVCEDVIGPPADVLCGYDAWLGWQQDGYCPNIGKSAPSSSSTAATTSTAAATSSTAAAISPGTTTTTTFASTAADVGGPDGFPFIPTTPDPESNETKTMSTTSVFNEVTLWPPGEQLVDYSNCNFDCCTNEDCRVPGVMEDRCCTDGMCQVKASWMDPTPGVCPEVVGPPADVLCGYDAWSSWQQDGYCPGKDSGSTTTTVAASAGATASTTTVDATATTVTTTTTTAGGGGASTDGTTTSPTAGPIVGQTGSTATGSPTGSPVVGSTSTSSSDPTTAATTAPITATMSSSTNGTTNTPSTTSNAPKAPTSNTDPTAEDQDVFSVSEFENDMEAPRTSSGYAHSAHFSNRKLSWKMMMTTFMGIIIVSMIFSSGRESESGMNLGFNNLFGKGKWAVAAMAVTSLYSKSHPATINGNVGNLTTNFQAQQRGQRNLQGLQEDDTCIYNVEILLSGCDHSLQINAPNSRIIDMVMTDFTTRTNESDECVEEYEANLTFPVTDRVVELGPSPEGEGASPITVANLPSESCIRVIEGRPFVGKSGEILQAVPYFSAMGSGSEVEEGSDGSTSSFNSWSFLGSSKTCLTQLDGEKMCIATNDNTNSNATASSSPISITLSSKSNHRYYLLAEEWTNRALGEHSSIASFSAFSIALMTNSAPSTLVQDALVAGMDEIRHARTSFDIASKLLGGRDDVAGVDVGAGGVGHLVGPGPLPESKHEFVRNMTALALAVAKEGCLDETLSAFAAALEVEEIDQVLLLENNNYGDKDEDRSLLPPTQPSKYSEIDREILAFIRNELHTIAMEESTHSALAWRTLQWACEVDSSACDAVESYVFEEKKLELAFRHRFGGGFGGGGAVNGGNYRGNGAKGVLAMVKSEWNIVYKAYLQIMDGTLVRDCANLDMKAGFREGTTSTSASDKSLLSAMTENIVRGILRRGRERSLIKGKSQQTSSLQ